MNDEERLAAILEAVFEKLGLGKFAENLEKANKEMKSSEAKRKAQLELEKQTKEAFKELNKKLTDGRKKYIDLGDDLKKLNEAILDVTNVKKREGLEAQRELLAKKFINETRNKAEIDLAKMLGQTLVKGIWKASTTLVSSLQSGGSGVAMAADLMSTAIDTTQNAFVGLAKTGETMGTAMIAAGGKSTKLGTRLLFGATALEYFTNAVAATTKQGVQLLAAEAEKTIKAYQTATSAGALFGRGMDDMRMYATRAGLSVEQFSEVIKNNSQALADSGLTVTTAAKAVADVSSRLAKDTGKSGLTLQKEMQNLGFGFAEQAELVAQVMVGYKRAGSQANNREMAEATVSMAKNMRIVSDILGDEAKSRREATEKLATQYAYAEKVNKIAKETNDPFLAERLKASLALKSGDQQIAAMQYYVSGAITNTAAMLQDSGKSAMQWGDSVNAGRTSVEELSRGTAELSDRMQSGTDQVGTALSKQSMLIGTNSDLAKSYDELYNMSFKTGSANINKAIADAEQLSGANSGLQNELTGVEAAAQKLKMSIQDILTPSIVKFGKVSTEVLDSVRKAVDGAFGKSSGKSSGSSLGRGAAVVLGGIAGIGATMAAAPATMGASLAVGIPTVLGGAALGGELYDKTIGGYDTGGIADGPKSGYPATLHGTDAVVPLSDNRSIPVSMDTGALTSAVNQQSGILTEILRVMRDNNTLTSGILQHSM